MSVLKKALAAVALVGTMAIPALAADFGAAGCVVTDHIDGKKFVVSGRNMMGEGAGEQALRKLKNFFGTEHQEQRHGGVYNALVGRVQPGFNGTSKEWAVIKAQDEMGHGIPLKVVGDEPLWVEKISGWGPELDGKDAVIYECTYANEDVAAEVKKNLGTSWDVPKTPFGIQYIDPRDETAPDGTKLNPTWRFEQDRTRILDKIYPDFKPQ